MNSIIPPPPRITKARKYGPPLPCPSVSKRLLVRLAPAQVGMFRFLLEAYEHLAYFTVLERQTALLKVVFSPHRERYTREALAQIGESLPLNIQEWPSECPVQGNARDMSK